ncbi:MAG: 2-oxo acid dehydrogenase subunit E2 [Gemmatimonadota bacterium]|jgi:pyruvate dehydrogenase E2 component (dihydrolipoamide acetyltransferase)
MSGDAREDLRGPADVIRLSAIRRRIAKHMRASKAAAAHTLMAIEVDYSAVDAARASGRSAGLKLSYLPFVARSLAATVEDFPRLNASVEERELHVYTRLNLGIAVDLDFEGLIVPVIRGAADMDLLQLSSAIEDLSGRAKAGKLDVNEVAGGTFTITNAGGYGTLFTGAIINHPQVAILSTDGVLPKPVAIAREGGGYDVAVRPIGVLALTWDHRAFDGAYTAAALQRLKHQLESRDWTAELEAAQSLRARLEDQKRA